jgi:hypothetical protein
MTPGFTNTDPVAIHLTAGLQKSTRDVLQLARQFREERFGSPCCPACARQGGVAARIEGVRRNRTDTAGGGRYRLPAVAVLSVLGLLTLGAALLGAATAAPAPSPASAFAQNVLAEATVPPGGQPTTTIDSLEGDWLTSVGRPGVEGIVDVHSLYFYDEPPDTVASYVQTHLPPGATFAGTGTATGIAKFVTVSLPVAGPNEYMARLIYAAAPTNDTFTHSELRIDAQTVWVPDRPATERAPTGGVVEVTGFRSASPRTGSRGPVTVVVPTVRARTLVDDLNALPLGPEGGVCMEVTPLWSVTFRPSLGAAPTFVAQDVGCDGWVDVTQHGRSMPLVLDRNCTILQDVAALLPSTAQATRSAATTCRS